MNGEPSQGKHDRPDGHANAVLRQLRKASQMLACE